MNKENLWSAYEKMFLIRRLEEDLVKYYFDNKIMSFVHFYVGQEAVAVGVCNNLSKEDIAFGNHRSHGHYLAKGGDPGAMVAELLGRSTGCCKGKGGSMHMIDKSVNFNGSTPILGSVAPISAGSALKQKLQKSENITVCFYGDGASEEGVVYETMNFAAKFKLPLIMVVENNLYSVMSKLSDRRSESYRLETIALGFGCAYMEADGNDYLSVAKQFNMAKTLIKNSNIPVIIECKVYRHMAHSAPICDDKIGYREQLDNPENRNKNDSVKKLRNQLLVDFTETEISNLEEKINKEVKAAIDFGVNSPYPEKLKLYEDVYHE